MADRIGARRAAATPDAPGRIAARLARARAAATRAIHVLHGDPHPCSPFRKGTQGAKPRPGDLPLAGEPRFWKQGSSACHGTGVDANLKARAITQPVVSGAVATVCVSSTVRRASDLGYAVPLPRDARPGFDLPGHDGGRIAMVTVRRVMLSLLGTDFATLTDVDACASRGAPGGDPPAPQGQASNT